MADLAPVATVPDSDEVSDLGELGVGCSLRFFHPAYTMGPAARLAASTIAARGARLHGTLM